MKLYSYVVTHDTGFAPNPFWGYCTLANCKPTIRRTAKVGDWIVGLSPKAKGNRLIYAMQVEKILTYHQYYRDSRFKAKIPDYARGEVVYKCGDNIYTPLPNGDFRQLQSTHSNGTDEDPKKKAHDLGGKNVLISKTFYYRGSKALDLPETLADLKVGRAHKSRFSPDIVSTFINFISRRRAGVTAPPTTWPPGDDSWKMVRPMRIIFSRKGFDSSFGGKPSPILSDGRMVSLPIPDKRSPIRYKDIRWQDYNLGTLVSELTGGRIPASHFAHLDPDIRSESLSRHSEWRPLFGQTGAAQGHLRKNGVQAGDIFLFFGLFRNVMQSSGKLEWSRRSPLRHILWGWLQIDEVLKVDGCSRSKYPWAKYHPHFHSNFGTNNTLYIARRRLKLPGVSSRRLPGAGVFPHFSEQLVLTAPAATTPSQWELPQWFYPRDGKCPLTYHSDLARWQRTENGTRLNVVARGQEFILDVGEFPEAIEWLKMLLEGP